MLRVLSQHIIEPVSLEAVKEHLRISFSDEDNFLTSLITKVREYVEIYLNQSLAVKQYELILDDLPEDGFNLPFTPIISIDTMQYGFDEEEERIDIGYRYSSSSNRLFFDSSVIRISEPLDAFRCVFTAGMNKIPKRIEQAILMMIGYWYENREEVLINVNFVRLPYGAKMLLDLERGVMI